MGLNVELLRTSFSAVAPRADELVEKFYATLFMRYPQVVPLFEKVEMSKQRRMLANAIVFAVEHLDKPDEFTKGLTEMGKRHVHYGALPDHYPAVVECLLHALSSVAGDLWNEELEAEWTKALEVISQTMLDGAAEVAEVKASQ